MIAQIRFKNKKGYTVPYTYQTYIPDLECGDLVIVETRGSYSIAKFCGYRNDERPEDFPFKLKYIVEKINPDLYEEAKCRYREAEA